MRRKVLAAAFVAVIAAVSYRRWLRPWQGRWGATDEEVAMALPGDGSLTEPAAQLTRAITIDAPRAEVWPWIVQLGADRGGFYTYDWVENLLGFEIRSADQIVERWQELEVGDVVHMDRARTSGWYVVDLRPREALVLQLADLAAGRPLRRDEKLHWEFLWTFVLLDAPGGSTRLLVREHVAFGGTLAELLFSSVGLGSFVMTRGMLLGIKSRVESRGALTQAPSSSSHRGAGGRSG